METTKEALRAAITAAGGGEKLGQALGITRQAISQWPEVPAERVLEVERLSGVLRHRLRPDIYPAADTPKTLPRTTAPITGL